MTAGPPRLTLLTRAGCHRCGPAREALAAVRAATGVEWAETDIDQDAELREEYGDQVPVVLVDGQFAAAYVIDSEMLIAALNQSF